MYVDSQLLLSDAQAVTAAAASTNYIDLGLAGRNIGTGESLYVVLVVDVALTDASSDSTVEVKLEMDDNTSFSSEADLQVLFTVAATAAAGTKYIARISSNSAIEQYVRAYYTPANGNLTTGSFTTFITKDVSDYASYANGYTIS